MQEIWKDVPSYEGLYQISNLGNVKSLEKTWYVGKRLTSKRIKKDSLIYQRTDRDGYKIVSFRKNSNIKYFKVHRLVAQIFIKNKDNKPEVNHADGDKSNNSVSNLEWVTRKENVLHASKNNLLKTGSNCSWATPILQFSKEGVFIREWDYIKQAADELSLNKSCISATCSKLQKTSGGFIWKYKNK